MNDYEFNKYDFENPSFLFVLEDKLKGALGGPLFYNPYIKSFKLRGDELVLDFGCGGGAGSKFLLRFLNRKGHLTCLDISSYWMKKAKKRLKNFSNIDYKVGDIRKMNVPNSSFDIISIIHVIHDIEPSKRQDTLTALARTLKPGGALHIREPTREAHGMPISEIRTLMSNAGLKETEYLTKKSEYIGKFEK